MEIYIIILLRLVDLFHVRICDLIDVIMPLNKIHGNILGIPAHAQNFYYSIHRLEILGLLAQEKENTMEEEKENTKRNNYYILTEAGQSFISAVFSSQFPFDHLIENIKTNFSPFSYRRPLPKSRPETYANPSINKYIESSKSIRLSSPRIEHNSGITEAREDQECPEKKDLDELYEILADYIPNKPVEKLHAFGNWIIQSKNLTNAKIHAKLITHFWGDESLVPKSVGDSLIELANKILDFCH